MQSGLEPSDLKHTSIISLQENHKVPQMFTGFCSSMYPHLGINPKSQKEYNKGITNSWKKYANSCVCVCVCVCV